MKNFLKNFMKKLIMTIGIITLLEIVIAIGVGIYFLAQKESVPEKTFLELNLDAPLTEYKPDDPATLMMSEKETRVLDVVEALEKASEDDRVMGLVAKVGSPRMGLARTQDIRDAVLAFRKKGKMAIAHSQGFGTGISGYYLSTAFEKIYLQPSGDIGLNGICWEGMFIKGALEKLGVVPRMSKRQEYKSGANFYTERQFTDPHKEATCGVMNGMFGQVVRGIAEARELPEENVRSLMDYGLFLGQEALNAKLVDQIAYEDEVYEDIKKRMGEDIQFLSLMPYLDRAGSPNTDGEAIALIYGVGAIEPGQSKYRPLSGEAVMGSETVSEAFQAAVKDEDVKAIIFRINSPGGSYLASDTIWRETIRAKEAGKPVIASMGNVAGSGGYFVAMAADQIIAQPATITGSIGVYSGKMLTSGFWDKVGISWDEVHTSTNATMWRQTYDYTPEQWRLLQGTLDWVYADFTDKVASGRGMSVEDVLEVAKGRIWTGEDAINLGLVDELGGIPDAIRMAKAAAGLPEDAEICLKVFPKEKPWLEMLMEKGFMKRNENATAAAVSRMLEDIRPLLRMVNRLGLTRSRGLLSMPEMSGEGLEQIEPLL